MFINMEKRIEKEKKHIKVIVIPADSISHGISRSHYFTKGLAQYYDVYKLIWKDPQDAQFLKIKINKLYTLKCFLKSLLTTIKIRYDSQINCKTVRLPRLTFMIIYKILGMEYSMKIARFFNKRMLKKLIKNITPDVILYADGFDLYPAITGDHIILSDVQDDFDCDNFRNSDYQKRYGHLNFNFSNKNFIVSLSAKWKLEKYYNTRFDFLPNGVDIKGMLNIDLDVLNSYKQKYCTGDKLYVSYIGGRAWVDDNFAIELFNIAQKEYPFIQFLLIGNHKNYNLKNVTNLGSLSNFRTYYFYHLSDVGIMLKESENSEFLENSLPLKIVQYSVLNKYFVAPKIKWLLEENFSNIQVLTDYSPNILLTELQQFWQKGKKITPDPKWSNYDWNQINLSLVNFINNNAK